MGCHTKYFIRDSGLFGFARIASHSIEAAPAGSLDASIPDLLTIAGYRDETLRPASNSIDLRSPEAVKKLNWANLNRPVSESTGENARGAHVPPGWRGRVGPLSPCARLGPEVIDFQFFHSFPCTP